MKLKTFALFVAALFATSLFAEPPVRKTIIIKDGQMIVDGKKVDMPMHLDEHVIQIPSFDVGKRAWLAVPLL